MYFLHWTIICSTVHWTLHKSQIERRIFFVEEATYPHIGGQIFYGVMILEIATWSKQAIVFVRNSFFIVISHGLHEDFHFPLIFCFKLKSIDSRRQAGFVRLPFLPSHAWKSSDLSRQLRNNSFKNDSIREI